MIRLLLSLDGFEGEDFDDEMIADAVRAVLIERYTAFLWEGAFNYAGDMQDIFSRTQSYNVITLAVADQLRPAIEYVLGPAWVKTYISPPMVRVTRTKFDLLLEFQR